MFWKYVNKVVVLNNLNVCQKDEENIIFGVGNLIFKQKVACNYSYQLINFKACDKNGVV